MKTKSGHVSLTLEAGKKLASLYVQCGADIGRDGWVWWVDAAPSVWDGYRDASAGKAKTWAGAYRAGMRCAERVLRRKS